MSSEYQSLPLATRQAAMSAAEALAPERSVDEVRESLSVTEKGQPANTIGNCRTVFCHDPLLRGAIRLNLLTDRVDIVQDLGWRRNTSALTDTDVKYLLLYFEQTYGLTSEKKMTAALSIVANENCYHPIQDVLNGLVWDGTPRIRSCLHHFLGADESDYVEEMLKHFLLGAIRRVFRPGSKYEEMLCLVGGQGAGKSSFFRLLAIRDEWFSDDLKKLDDDRVYLKLQGHWIIEMSDKARCFDTLEKNLVRCRISPTRFIAGKTSVISHNHRLKCIPYIHSGFHQCRQLHGSQITHPCIIRCNVFIVCRYAI